MGSPGLVVEPFGFSSKDQERMDHVPVVTLGGRGGGFGEGEGKDRSLKGLKEDSTCGRWVHEEGSQGGNGTVDRR